MGKILDYLVAILILAAFGMTTSSDVPTRGVAFAFFLEPGSVYAFAALPEDTMKQREARLIEGAKKEGNMVFWASSAARENEQVLAAFRQRYPFLKTEQWTADSTVRHQKILAEARAGAYNVDVYVSNTEHLLELKKAGLMKKYDWPNTRGWSPSHKDAEGYWIYRAINPVVVAYNTNLVSAAETPKSWEDVLDPKWKGAISADRDGGDFVLMLWSVWGKEKTIAYLKRLSRNVVLGASNAARTEMVAGGAYKIDVQLNLSRVLQYQEKGAPLEWVRTNPILAEGTPMFVAEHALHPNAAMLFADWFTSLEGGQVYYDASGKLLPHPGIKSKIAEALKGLNTVFALADTAVHGNEAKKIFQDIFWK